MRMQRTYLQQEGSPSRLFFALRRVTAGAHKSNRYFYLLFLFLVVAVNAHAVGAGSSYVHGSSISPQDPQSSVTLAFHSTQFAGDLNVVVVGWNDSTSHIQSVTDTAGNTYVLAIGPTVYASWTQAIYYAKNIVAASTNSVTVTFDALATYPDIRIAEYSGIDPVNPIDTSVVATGDSDAEDSGNITTTNDHDLLVAANVVETETDEGDPDYMIRIITQPDGDILEDRLVTTAGTYHATAGTNPSGKWIMQVVAFRVIANPRPDFIQSSNGTPQEPSDSVPVFFPSAQRAGDLNVVVVGWNDSTAQVQSVADSAGNLYTLAIGPTVNPGYASQAIYFAKNIVASAANEVTVAFTSPASYPDIRIAEYSGLDPTNPVDAVSGEQGSGDQADTGFINTTHIHDLIVAADTVGTVTSETDCEVAVRLYTQDADILQDKVVVDTGSYDSTAGVSPPSYWVMQAVAFRVADNQSPVVDAGPNQSISLPTNTVTLSGTATDDGLPSNTLSISWTELSGPSGVTFINANAAVTQATFPGAGTYVLQLTADDSQLSSSATTTVTVNPAAIVVTLSPTMAGPDVTGTNQTFTAAVTSSGTPVSGTTVQFTVTGANPTTTNATTDANGTTTLTYSGTNNGDDTIQASSQSANSNTATVSWITPVEPISTSTVYGRFFASDNSQEFDTPPTATPAFTQFFPTIDFNPPGGTVPGNTSGVDVNSRPFADVTTDLNGNFTGTIVAQGNGFQAGVGPMNYFNAVFTGNLTIASAGNVTLNFFSDDGFILGISGGATRVSGPMINVPNSGLSPFADLPVVGSYNQGSAPTGNSVVVNFPAPGTYPYEVDYNECCGGQESLTMAVSQASSTGVPPTGSLTVTPASPSTLNAGQTQTFTVQAYDASGAAVQNLGVAFIINGANLQQLSGTTDATGRVTFQYSGVNAGTDTVQAIANISGMAAISNIVTVPWSVPPGGGGGTVKFVPQGWIGSPTLGTIVQGQVPITVASGVTLTGGILEYWPTGHLDQISVLNDNTTGSGTIGTFDTTLVASGDYTIQLQAAASDGSTQTSLIAVSVRGEEKPGRMTTSVTDLKVPIAGIPINVTRTYDSLNRDKTGDFGNGWNLSTNVDLQVGATLEVTLTLDGKRQTFYFGATTSSVFFSWLLQPTYIPQPGVHGTLTSDGCSAVIKVQNDVVCFPSGEEYLPTTYTYTDPAGRVYVISANGDLRSIKDLSGNTVTFTPQGITSSVDGVVVPFTRDSSGRITQITDLNGNNYVYSYDANGNLESVSLPGTSNPETYTYTTDHLLLSSTDPLGNSTSATYHSSGRLATSTNADGTTQYSYNLTANSVTTTFPDGGVMVQTNDTLGNPLSIKDPLNRTTTYTYDSNENLITKTDPLGKTTTYTYDANGFRTSVQDPLGDTSSKVYNQFGEATSASDAVGNNSTFTYDSNFNPNGASDSIGQVFSATYDLMGDPLTVTDANGKTAHLAYDSRGNLTQQTDPLGRITSYTYDDMDRVLTTTDPKHGLTQYGYDALGRMTTLTNALGQVTHYEYDDNGNRTAAVDALSHRTTYTYDALNRLIKITYPDNTTKQYTYDFRGNKLTETDQAGHTTKYEYDLAGQLTRVTYAYGTPDAGSVQYTYDADGRKKTMTDELGNLTTYNYDDAGRMTSVVNALNQTTGYGYDADSRRTSITDANTHTTQFAYDARSRLTTVTYPDTTTNSYTYDGMGRQLTMTDQAGKVTTRAYDDAGQLSSVTDALNHATQYGYDSNSNLTSITDANGHVTSFQYDSLNRRILRQLPLSMSETRSYDAVGNLSAATDFNGKTTTYTYDTLNRLLSKTPDPSLSQPTISFTYTSTGQRATMADATGTTTYSYDNRDRLTSEATPEGTLSYTYDAHGNVLTINSSNTNGASMTYSYDALNRLSTVTDNRLVAQGVNPATTTYSYDAVSNMAGYTLPDGIQTADTYDPLNRLTELVAAKSGTTLASYGYTLGLAGNRTGVAELGGRTVNYGYDNVYRLTSEAITGDPAGNNGTVNYTYDPVGNRTNMTSTLAAVPGGSFSYDANDRLSIDSYDNNGNTTSSAGISFSYDFENRMLMRGSLTIGYDGDGNRVSETVAGTTAKYLVDTLNPTGYSQVMDEIVNGSVTRTYAYGLTRISEDQLVGSTWIPSFYGYDGHGNVRFLADVTGALTDTYQFDAFGNEIANTGTTANDYLFSGERWDQNISLYHLRARYYNPATGRFETMDPAEGDILIPTMQHRYVYSRNNPINVIDPTGRSALLEGVYIDLNAGIFSTDLLPLAVKIGFGTGVASCVSATTAHSLYVGAEDLANLFDYEIPYKDYTSDILEKVQDWCEAYFPD